MLLHYEVLCVTGLCVLGFLSFTCCEPGGPPGGSSAGDWLHFVDDYGKSLVLNFSTIFVDTEDTIVGDVYFYLYTRKNEYKPEALIVSETNDPFKSVYFNNSNDIKIVTHGWRSGENVDWMQNVKRSFLREFDINVVTVDWNELAKNDIYPLAAFSTRYVGSRVAKLVTTFIRTYSVTGQNFHLIGHSLGAHVMGYAGMFSNETIFRITGLDPARPLFEVPIMPSEYRLDKSDAEFVDIIHTCGGVYGYEQSYGHADFYPNNGYPMQPGCSGTRQVLESCSHSRAHEYFEESIEYTSENGFIAYSCENWEKFENSKCKNNPTTSMGYPASPKSNGNYFLRTRNESKYAS